MIRLDLHTHSVDSPDGSLKLEDYKRLLSSGKVGVIAITDHDKIEYALKVHAALGERIIVGEEITSAQGEIIGLYLTERIAPGLSALETVQMIKKQGGSVYIPHPFETVRRGVTPEVLEAIASFVDIVEVHNGRAVFQNRGTEARAWAERHNVAMAASSDAHGWHGWGKTASVVAEMPTRETLVPLLRQYGGALYTGTVGWRGLLYPKLNRFRKKLI